MANDRLRSALAAAGLEIEDLAAKAEVDTKTVQRWLGGRTPRARYRAKIANVLDQEEVDLWPEIASATTIGDDRRELTGLYAHANDYRAPDWRTLLPLAREQIDLLDYTLADILDTPGVTDALPTRPPPAARSGS